MDASDHPLRTYRLSQNPPLSQEDLADRVNTTKATISRIETGMQESVRKTLLLDLVAETAIPAARLFPELAKLFTARPVRRRARHTSRAAA